MADDVFGESQNIVVHTTYIIHNGHILLKVVISFIMLKQVGLFIISCSFESHLMEIKSSHYIRFYAHIFAL